MRDLGLALFLSGGVWLLGCSDGPSNSSTADVTGNWCGKKVSTPAECLGDSVEYLELTQGANGVVTGVNCEEFGRDCYEVQSGKYASGRLTYFYTFSGYRVDGDFTSSNEDTLAGALSSNKCGCQVPITFYRIP